MKNLGRFLAVFVLLSLPAFAQADFTLYAGAQFPGKITLSQVQSGTTQTLSDPIKAGVFGMRFGGGRVFGHETTLAFAPNFLDSNTKAVILSENIRIQVPSPVLRPYVTAGTGPILSWGSGPSDIGNKFAINYGGGIKVKPKGPIGVRFDARGYSVFSVQGQTLQLGEVTVGLLFGF